MVENEFENELSMNTNLGIDSPKPLKHFKKTTVLPKRHPKTVGKRCKKPL